MVEGVREDESEGEGGESNDSEEGGWGCQVCECLSGTCNELSRTLQSGGGRVLSLAGTAP